MQPGRLKERLQDYIYIYSIIRDLKKKADHKNNYTDITKTTQLKNENHQASLFAFSDVQRADINIADAIIKLL